MIDALVPPSPSAWTGPGTQCVSAGAPLRTIRVSDTTELAAANRILADEPYPRRFITVLIIGSALSTTKLAAEDAAHIDLVLAAGTQEDESTLNIPLVFVVDPEAELARIEEAVRSHPQVSEIFIRLLRNTAGLALEPAMEMESLAYSALLGGEDFTRWIEDKAKSTPAKPTPVRPAADGDLVLIEREEGVLRLTLNDPARHNAYSAELRDHLLEALTLPIIDDSISAVELRGAGRSFCSGADLGEFGMATDLAAAHLIRSQQHVGRMLTRLGTRVVVHVHGACIGAGIEIPAYAHRLSAKPTTFFRLPELRMGLIPAAGGSVSIPRRIGRWRTLYMVLTGLDVRAARALRWGLVDEVTPS